MRTILHIVFSHVKGGYQPAQKWLKDRKGRGLGFDDVKHYHKIIKALVENDRIMGEIDRVALDNFYETKLGGIIKCNLE